MAGSFLTVCQDILTNNEVHAKLLKNEWHLTLGYSPPFSTALCMGVPDHPTLSLSSFTDKPTLPHTLCRAMLPITTLGALAKAGLGEQLDGVWVR